MGFNMVDNNLLNVVPRDRDDDTGKYEEVYDDETIVAVLRGTRLSTSEVADELGCHRTTAHSRLVDLEDENMVVSSPVGNTLIWELSGEQNN